MNNFVRTIQFEPSGEVIIDFTRLPQDVRANGLMLNHTLFVPSSSDYDDGIDALRDNALALLADALEDAERVGPMLIKPDNPTDDDGDDDDDDEGDGQ